MSKKKFVNYARVDEDMDTSNRLLYVAFQLLVDFVEVEKAKEWAYIHRSKEEMPLYWWPLSRRFYKWYRNAEIGIKRLEEEQGIMVEKDYPSAQSHNATEILNLYSWWKNVRPERKNPVDVVKPVVGQGDLGFADSDTEDEFLAMEHKHWQEDQDMLIRLMEIRDALWS